MENELLIAEEELKKVDLYIDQYGDFYNEINDIVEFKKTLIKDKYLYEKCKTIFYSTCHICYEISSLDSFCNCDIYPDGTDRWDLKEYFLLYEKVDSKYSKLKSIIENNSLSNLASSEEFIIYPEELEENFGKIFRSELAPESNQDSNQSENVSLTSETNKSKYNSIKNSLLLRIGIGFLGNFLLLYGCVFLVQKLKHPNYNRDNYNSVVYTDENDTDSFDDDFTEEYPSEIEYQDGEYSAEIEYYNSDTGKHSDYELSVEVENGKLVKIEWPNGGWLDDSHFSPPDISDGTASFKDDRGRDYDIRLIKD
jgi:hypothetical protein